MKALIYALFGVLVGSVPLLGGEPEAGKKPQADAVLSKPGKKDKPVTTVLTGSYIKREIRQSGQITDGPYQVVVYDAETIRRSGAGDLADFLRRRGAGR